MDTNDPPTVQDIAGGYQTQLKAEPAAGHQQRPARCSLRGGRLAARRRRSSSNQPAVRDALAGRDSFSLLPQPNGILQLVTVPITLERPQPRHPRHPQRRLPARRRARGAAEGDHRQRRRLRHGRPDPRHDAAARGRTRRWRSRLRGHRHLAHCTLDGEEYVALPLPLAAGEPRRGLGPGRADPALAHRAAAVARRDPHRPRDHGGARGRCSPRFSASRSRAPSRSRSPPSPT